MLTDKAIAYLEGRKIDVEVAQRLGVDSYEPDNGGECLDFPFVWEGKVISHKYRPLDRKGFWQTKDAPRKVPWNADVLRDESLHGETLVITEGEIDALTFASCGHVFVISIPDGAPSEPESAERSHDLKWAWVQDVIPLIKKVKTIVLAMDGDDPGRIARDELAMRLGKGRCKWMRYPVGCKDINEAVQKHGERAVTLCMANAEWIKLDGVYTLSKLPPMPISGIRYSTTIPGLDDHWQIRTRDFGVIGGVPGHGKTTMTNALTAGMAMAHGWKWAVCSPEQDPRTDHQRALREFYLGKKIGLATAEERAAADAWIDQHFVFMIPPDDVLADLPWFLRTAADAKARHEVNGILLDPWNELDHARPRDVSLTEYVGMAIKELKRSARELDAYMLVVAHPSKMETNAKGEPKEPGMYDLSDSAHWANKADTGAMLWRQGLLTKISIKKSRYWDILGEPGDVWVRYNADTRRFEEALPPMDSTPEGRAFQAKFEGKDKR